MVNELVFLLISAGCRAEVAAAAAILVVLLIRIPARRLLGAGLAYRLWALPLAAALASLFPSLPEMLDGPALVEKAMSSFDGATGTRILLVWSGGALLILLLMVGSELRFRRLAQRGLAGPAVMGLGWLRLVTPSDFRSRFSASEQGLILNHERAHMARCDPQVRVLLSVLLAISWFNPLAYVATVLARFDQELACDDAVIRNRPDIRRAYAETLLKAQLTATQSLFACAFTGGRHPLELRLTTLARPQPSLGRYLVGLTGIGGLTALMVIAVWATTPTAQANAPLFMGRVYKAIAAYSTG